MVEITQDFATAGRNLGNKLFTYAVGSIIAKELGYTLKIPSSSYIQRGGQNKLFPFQGTKRKEIHQPVLSVCDGGMQQKTINGVLEEGKEKKIELPGYYLKYENIKQHKTYIKELYSTLVDDFTEEGSTIILLRDSKVDPTFKLPNSYYIQQLEKLNIRKLYISFDHYDRHKDLINQLSKYNPILLDLDILELFRKITSMETIIASQGTYSFWTSLLSNAKTIIWPITELGPNKATDSNVDLVVNDEDRYKFIYVDNG